MAEKPTPKKLKMDSNSDFLNNLEPIEFLLLSEEGLLSVEDETLVKEEPLQGLLAAQEESFLGLLPCKELPELPAELWLKILANLTLAEISMFGVTCHDYNALSNDSSLWKNLSIDVSSIRKSLDAIYARIDRTTKVETLRITNKNKEDCRYFNMEIESVIFRTKDNLRELYLDFNINQPQEELITFQNSVITSFNCLTKLEVLEFDAVFLKRTGVNAIASLKNLKKLKIPNIGCHKSYGYGVGSINDMSSIVLEYLFQELNLVQLDLTRCEFVINVEVLSRNNPNLEHLVLDLCDNLENITPLSQNCKKLKHLSMYECTKPSDILIRNITKNCKRMKFLSLKFCSQITDTTVQEIALNCNDLRHLDLRGCRLVTESVAKSLAMYCPNLELMKPTALIMEEEVLNRHKDENVMHIGEAIVDLVMDIEVEDEDDNEHEVIDLDIEVLLDQLEDEFDNEEEIDEVIDQEEDENINEDDEDDNEEEVVELMMDIETGEDDLPFL